MTPRKASTYVETSTDDLSYDPDMVKFPVMVTSPVRAIAPVVPVIAIGVFVTPPSLMVTARFLSSDVCARVISPLLAEIVNSCPSPIVIPELLSIVRAPVVVSEASALRKLPPAITVADVFEVDETSIADACDEFPENDAPRDEFNVIPELIAAKPLVANGVTEGDPPSGVNASFDSTATLMLPTNMEDMTLLTPDAVTVSIFQPESVCPVVNTGPASNQADPV